ncbi:hypothetical protein B0A49_06883 [Cryomyces minteri]|uniref:MHD domain-containing protein n=1 Tax=Cryomyces minteri TaxID=331657 RepID=A0A4U0WRP2_9PEZI|nr:hypothetical protein B0A49_06883 [Cryomyces minteri]
MSRSEYPAMLATLQPSQAVNALNDRVKVERRRLEEQYAQALNKLARRQLLCEAAELGVFSNPWQKIVTSTESLAESHHLLAQKIEADVERPLRDFASTDREMQAMSTIQGNLTAMAREIDGAQKKADKLKEKGAKAAAGKVANATSDVDNARSQWASQAPFVFEKLQAVDESRLNHLRDALTQYLTHEVDQVERDRVTAEQCLNVLLNVETADEIKTFALKIDPAPEQKQSGGLSGLKRLGTVLGRRRGKAPSVSPERKTRPDLGSKFSSFGSRMGGRSKDTPPPMEAPQETPPSFRRQSPVDRRTSTPSRQADLSPTPRDKRRPFDRTNGMPTSGLANEPMTSPGFVNGTSRADPTSLREPLQPTAPSAAMPEPQRDSEGFSVPPSGRDAISQAEQEAAGGDDTIPPQFKVDIRDAPIQEEGHDAETALANVANTLRMQAPTGPGRRQGTLRGRRDVRNTVFVPSPQQNPEIPREEPSPASMQPILPPIAPVSPFKSNPRAAYLNDEQNAFSDTQSVRSATSATSAVIKHPELSQPGLNSSIVETVSAWFEHGALTRSVVIGELALAYNPPDLAAAAFGTSEAIRLENFHVLEKVAPNPTFIEPLAHRAGEYTVALPSITAKTVVAFKYQVHLSDATFAAHVPLLLTPVWKVEPTQTSVILHYALNPSFPLPPAATPSPSPTKPVGTFSRSKALIYWPLGAVTLVPNAPPQKLLARFLTETEGRPGNVEATWDAVGEAAGVLGSGLAVSVKAEDKGKGKQPETDPFADEEGAGLGKEALETPGLVAVWREVQGPRKVGSGTYVAT